MVILKPDQGQIKEQEKGQCKTKMAGEGKGNKKTVRKVLFDIFEV